MTGTTTLVEVIALPGVQGTGITLGHAVILVIIAVTVDVDHAMVDTPPPIAMTGSTPALDIARLHLQPRV